ncbi:MAG: 1-acyl-sn-glycerol-3-phosphate acyltransferase [Isosphaeraceae bacterium]|nr:1-acyl-sn-glycerol-3-phosphate acyltransferase [Isosphaeraceae bacterium]
MKQLPLAHELPYRFYEPRLSRALMWAGRFHLEATLRDPYRIEQLDVAGLEHVAPLLARGDGVLLAPNHSDHADCYVMFELSRRLGIPFYYMAAFQIFTGKNRWILPRIGVFPVDREGTDLRAFKTGVSILGTGRNPLVIFPEGEIYHLGERLTPLREGAVAVAAAAAKKRVEAGKTVWVVPVALKYRFLDNADPLPSLLSLLDRLESRFTWWPDSGGCPIRRIYRFAEGMLGLKEFEYLGTSQQGTLKERIAGLTGTILGRIEQRHVGKVREDTVPVRVKELRRSCLERLANPATPPDEARQLRRDLHDLFMAMQSFSYPGDYVRESPTLERVAETLMKFDEDFLGVAESHPHAARRAVVRLGEPIDVRERLAAPGKSRVAVAALTTELETKMQSLLDTIPPGRLIETQQPASTPVPVS